MATSLHLLGVMLALTAAFSSAVASLFVRMGTERGVVRDAIFLTALVNIVVLLPIVLVAFYPDYGTTPVSWLSFAAAGVAGTILARHFKYSSITTIGASRTEPIVASWVLVATVLGALLLGETLTPVHGLGIVLIVVGVSVIAWETSQDNPEDLSRRQLVVGLTLPLAAALVLAWEPIFANFGLAEGTPALVGVVVKTATGALGFALYLRYRAQLPTMRTIRARKTRWFLMAGLATTFVLVGYYTGLALAPVNVVVPIMATSTLFTVVLSALFMPTRLERVTLRLVAAAVVVVCGVVLVTAFS